MGIVIDRSKQFLAEEEFDIEPEADEPQIPEVEVLEKPTQPPEKPLEQQDSKVILRGLVPQTEKDFEVGFRQLTDNEYIQYQIPKNRTSYRTKEDASKNIFKISAARLGQHLKEISTFKHPPGYLWDSQGLTPECIAELRRKIQYTSRTIYPAEPNGEINFSKWKRGDLKKHGIENRDYGFRFQYWEEYAKRSQEYQSWLESQKQTNSSTDYHVYVGEWVFEENPEEREANLSNLRSQIELTSRRPFDFFSTYFTEKKRELVERARTAGAETRAEVEAAYSAEIEQQPDINEDEDL